MTNEGLTIVREYKAAKQPLKQIGILADLNGVDKSEIVRILREAGCELPKQYAPKAVKDAPVKQEKTELPYHKIAIDVIGNLCADAGEEHLRDQIYGVLQMVMAFEDWEED